MVDRKWKTYKGYLVLEKAFKSPEWFKTVKNVSRQTTLISNGLNWSEIVQNCSK